MTWFRFALLAVRSSKHVAILLPNKTGGGDFSGHFEGVAWHLDDAV